MNQTKQSCCQNFFARKNFGGFLIGGQGSTKFLSGKFLRISCLKRVQITLDSKIKSDFYLLSNDIQGGYLGISGKSLLDFNKHQNESRVFNSQSRHDGKVHVFVVLSQSNAWARKTSSLYELDDDWIPMWAHEKKPPTFHEILVG